LHFDAKVTHKLKQKKQGASLSFRIYYPKPMDSKQNKSHLQIIFATVFLYLLGFGIMIPIMPIIGREYGASPFEIGLLMSSYSLMQFIFAPFWGRLSDIKGRRPILLFCLAGEALSYLIFAFSSHLYGLMIARAMAGFFGASISTASASISDVTPDKERSKGMALIGVAFGLGFMLGPVLGGGFALLGEALLPEKGPTFGIHFASGSVALICLITFIFAWLRLKETVHLSRSNKRSPSHERETRLSLFGRFLRTPIIGPLIGNFFLNSLAMSAMEATLILFAADRFGWGVKEVSLGFAYIGTLSTINQGFFVRKILPYWGEKKLLTLGLFFQVIGYGFIGFSTSVPWLGLAMTLLSIGNGFVNPTLLGSISLLAKSSEQGEALGTAQSSGSLGRILGPLIGGWAYGHLGMSWPFFISSGLAFLGLSLVKVLGKKLPENAKNIQPNPFQNLNYFQFNNLVFNRIGFILLYEETINFAELYSGTELAHIKRYSISIKSHSKPSEWKLLIAESKLPEELPVIVLKKQNEASIKTLAQFGKLFQNLNICTVHGGWNQLKTEAKAEIQTKDDTGL